MDLFLHVRKHIQGRLCKRSRVFRVIRLAFLKSRASHQCVCSDALLLSTCCLFTEETNFSLVFFVCVVGSSTVHFHSWIFLTGLRRDLPFFCILPYPALPVYHCLSFLGVFFFLLANDQLRLSSPAFYVSITRSLTHSFVFVLFLITDTTVSSQKGKTAFNQSPVDHRAFSDGRHVLVLPCVLVCVLDFFANETKNISRFS